MTEWRGRKHMSHMKVWHSDVAQRSWKEKHQSVYLSVQVLLGFLGSLTTIKIDTQKPHFPNY